eukprot:SAG22_NODE_354_length_11811_cov_8.612620_9_plen_425_part_00
MLRQSMRPSRLARATPVPQLPALSARSGAAPRWCSRGPASVNSLLRSGARPPSALVPCRFLSASSAGGDGDGDGEDGKTAAAGDAVEEEAEEEEEEEEEISMVDAEELEPGGEVAERPEFRSVEEAGEDGTEEVTRIVADSGMPQRALTTTESDQPPHIPQVMAFPVSRRPLFPGTMQAITITKPWVMQSLQELSNAGHTHVGVFLESSEQAAKSAADDGGEPSELITDLREVQPMGVLASIVRIQPAGSAGEGAQLLLKGHRRIRINEVAEYDPIMRVAIDHHDNDDLDYDRHSDEIKAYTNEIMLTMRDMLKLNPLYKDNLLMMWNNDIPLDIGRLCDFMCGMSSADGAELQAILEELDITERVVKTLYLLKKELKMFELQRQLAAKVEAKCVAWPDMMTLCSSSCRPLSMRLRSPLFAYSR